jgi:hypothetical protein
MIRESQLDKVIEDGGKSPAPPHSNQPQQVGGCTSIRESELAKVIEEGGQSPQPCCPKHPEQTKTEDSRVMAERMRRARMRRNTSG